MLYVKCGLLVFTHNPQDPNTPNEEKSVLTKYFCILNEAHTDRPSLKEPLARVTRGGMHGRRNGNSGTREYR